MNRRAEKEYFIEINHTGNCFVLEDGLHCIVLHGNVHSIAFNVAQGELIKLLFENKDGMDKKEILINLHNIKEKNPESIKTDIRS
ncbi:hypothetical protein [Bacillus sp. X1(2014)]|uniref:hypothetical protein n=1 Tax=Bacillus sp. X1(2014) TaxID=1565991 RepID=UPI001642425B|nr:hypothetical protein [Bacillus sp. X1(2014)]